VGWGFDASRDLPGSDAIAYKGGAHLPLHPHNAALQIWLELGIPGVLIAAGIVIQLLRGLVGFAPRRRAAATGAAVLTMYGLIALMSFGIWQNWWVVTAWLAALIAAIAMAADAPQPPGALSRPLPRRHPRRRSVATGPARPPPPHRR
jgi:O-antigen ligase